MIGLNIKMPSGATFVVAVAQPFLRWLYILQRISVLANISLYLQMNADSLFMEKYQTMELK